MRFTQVLLRFLLIPQWKQFKLWSIPSKVGYVSFWISTISLFITVAIFEHQEKYFKDLTYLSIFLAKAENNKTQFVSSENTSMISDFLQYNQDLDPRDGGPLEFVGRKGIDFVVHRGHGISGTVEVYSDESAMNRIPQFKIDSEHGMIENMEYVEYAKGIDKGIYVTSIAGAGGKGFNINLFVRLRTGDYIDLFRDCGFSNSEHIFEDIDGDGVKEFAIIESCEICFYKLNFLLKMAQYSGPHFQDNSLRWCLQ